MKNTYLSPCLPFRILLSVRRDGFNFIFGSGDTIHQVLLVVSRSPGASDILVGESLPLPRSTGIRFL